MVLDLEVQMAGFLNNGILQVRGAYGRKASIADWEAGKDFRIVGGPYCSKRDLAVMARDGYAWVQILSDDHATTLKWVATSPVDDSDMGE